MTHLTKFSLLLSATALMGAKAQGSANLPYMGSEVTTCKVKQPEGELRGLDAGYIPNEDCSIVFVKPPLFGSIKMTEPFVSRRAQDICPDISRYRRQLGENLPEFGDPVGNAQWISRVRTFERAVDRITMRDGVSSIEGSAAAVAWLRWNELIAAYEQANKEASSIAFRPLPISIGAFTATQWDVHDTESSDTAKAWSNIAASVKILGFELPRDHTAIDWLPVPEMLDAIFTKGSYLMGQSTSIQFGFNLLGACNYVTEDGRILNDANGFLAGSYAYFYPVQTKAIYKVTVNRQNFLPAITQVLRGNKEGSASADQIARALDAHKALDITIDGGAFPGMKPEVLQEFISEYRETIMNQAGQILANSLLNLSKLAIEKATTTTYRRDSSKVCKRKFLFVKSCHTHHYDIRTENVDWEKVESFLRNGLTNVGVGANQYYTFYSFDTVAFQPESTKTFENDNSSPGDQ